uniref:Photosystem II assembly protein Ycf48 n=1 Tax=Glaucocystis incrassata TaxID=1789788 RepID=A0A3G1IVF2_9EUKA|nr:photosynthesis system II assembly factor Ycf48 [Glaucocystis incrassata]ASQ40025.1 photosynthesis system II assembly factor Ycf48 [Glaucocystis incrassata]
MIKVWRQILLILVILLISNINIKSITGLESNTWKLIPLQTNEILLDLGFVPGQPERGWLLGTHSTLYETTDFGKTWELRNLNLDDDKYRLNSISFSGKEGWIIGKPAILLHTIDGGSSWSRIALNNKLPGDPILITALGKDKAEMVTDVGAIYETSNGGQSWKAKVKEPLGVIRNINRSENGSYVAVSAKGNFYSLWTPDAEKWKSYSRQSARRIQNMGFTKDNKLWLLARGGQLWFSSSPSSNLDFESWEKPSVPEGKVGFSLGLLNLAYRTADEVWVAGGSGSLLSSKDGGHFWVKESSSENIPSNFYKIIFVNPELGFVLGNQGTLLRYESL